MSYDTKYFVTWNFTKLYCNNVTNVTKTKVITLKLKSKLVMTCLKICKIKISSFNNMLKQILHLSKLVKCRYSIKMYINIKNRVVLYTCIDINTSVQ